MEAKLCPTSLRTDVSYEFGFIVVANFIVMVSLPACLLAFFNIKLFQAIKVAEIFFTSDFMFYVSEIRGKSWVDQPGNDSPTQERQKACTASRPPCRPLWRVQPSQSRPQRRRVRPQSHSWQKLSLATVVSFLFMSRATSVTYLIFVTGTRGGGRGENLVMWRNLST